MIKITNKADCCGCEACANKCCVNCIDMVCDDEGFKYPNINMEKCINCGQCESVCPILNNIKTINNNVEGYAAINKNTDERMNSSSGGVFTLLAKEVLKSGGIVIGCSMSKDCMSAEHVIIYDVKDLYKITSSKYLQSNINNMYKLTEYNLKKGKKVLFSGTPCQVVALKKFLCKSYENLICIDLICHGVSSPGLWKTNAISLSKKYKSKIYSVNFRYKKYKFDYGTQIMFNNQKVYYKSKNEDAYMQLFLNNISLRESCYTCKFKGISRASDITLGDFWGIEKYVSSFNDGMGISIVVIQSKNGKKLFDKINFLTNCVNVDVNQVFKVSNIPMTASCTMPKGRNEFWDDYNKLHYEKLIKKYVKIPYKAIILGILRKVHLHKFILNTKKLLKNNKKG